MPYTKPPGLGPNQKHIRRFMRQESTLEEIAEDNKLTHSDIKCLLALGIEHYDPNSDGAIFLTEVNAYLPSNSESSISIAMRKLTEKGFARRVQFPQKKNKKLYRITPKGLFTYNSTAKKMNFY